MKVNQLSKTSNLFDDQYVTYSVIIDDSSELYCVSMHFEDYCTIILKNTSGLQWKFANEELAWAFVHSDFEINLYYIAKAIRKKCFQKDSIQNSKVEELHTKLCIYLGILKEVKTLIDCDGALVNIDSNTKLTFMAEIQHGAENFGSYEFSFELRLVMDSTFIVNFTSAEVGNIFDINEDVVNIVHALDSTDYINLINNRIKQFNIFPLEESEFKTVNNLYRFLEFLKG
jgi:hypothetical protein